MKSYMRSFLVLLLVLALPINGMAQLLMPVGSSAHHVMPDRVGIEAMAASHASMAGVSGAEPECCEANEHGTATVCKTGQECKTASILQLVSIKAQLMPAAKPVTTPYNGLIPSSLLDAVWHPPRV
ncbi:MAG: hypothetical protein CMK99_22430 [Pseudomonas sp.]|jgi:hypothetical protein|uniref:Uncharacterized protein n=2 Tax=Stutzerimonas TaxID=2901164 RepID=A0A365PWL9_9GAMM|nr:hypothetical protein C1896_22035 [Pseudomonadaceae bacterium SI-3]MAX93455.1 hypothetical protein [Pseudomonas sp.]MBK3848988.1 hypothetical protein [Stutzerimonas xanthomarina]PNF75032.1 hypothetical protein CXK95_17545 [Stutzerimonas degradans]RBA59962.1 hypothetical protein DQ403_08390 [Stutzerimonas zhaodongensis]BAP77538.1 hypothetical protein MT1_0362 [Pseudomonas sp. MT-1]|tara:strand:+ start:4783 stop:5160 length:378 start_codon:yes stop_codon:yes gene_type:complete